MLFKDVIAQNQIKEIFIKTVNQNRISHAQLFFENQGYGAFPLAIAYARYILCQNRQEKDACGECSSCLKINQLTHPDLHFSFPVQLDAKHKLSDDYLKEWREFIFEHQYYFTEEDWYKKTGNENKQGVIGKDESQSILKKLQLKSYEGNYKIVILFGADRMNTAASNKLLKLIEEPPAKTLFLLTTTSLQAILPTIISRTQLIKLKQPSPQQIANSLMTKEIPEEKATYIASNANGNIAYALQMSRGEETTEHFFDLFVTWMRICFSKDVAQAITFSQDMARLGREQQKSFLLYSLQLFQKSLSGNFITPNFLSINSSQTAFFKNFTPFVIPQNIVEIHNLLTLSHNSIDRNANAKILFLDLSFKLFVLIKKG